MTDMDEQTSPLARSPYTSAGVIVAGAIVAILLVTFAVSRFTRPEAPVVAQAPAAPSGPLRLTNPSAAPGAAPATVAAPAPVPVEAPPKAAAGPGAVTDPSLTAAAHGDDLVLARQLLMDGNETAMMPIDRAAGGEDIDMAILKTQAYAIYTWLSAAPHLFPAASKPVPAADGSPPSSAATAAIWEDFDAFYAAATDAASVAFDASQAANLAAFRPLAMKLRAACDSCHDKYMHVFDPAAGK